MTEKRGGILPDPDVLAAGVLRVSRREAIWRRTRWWGWCVGILGTGVGFWGGAEWWRMAAVFATGVAGSIATNHLLFKFAERDLNRVWSAEK